MKKALISIHPGWVQKILNGNKTIEVRSWRPKEEDLPCKVYIYVTKGKSYLTQQSKTQFTIRETKDFTNLVNGKVVASFILNKVESFNPKLGHPKIYISACVSDTELVKIYPNKKHLYAWKIDDLVIFDKPKELGEFVRANPCKSKHLPRLLPLTKAPQKMVWVDD